MPDYYFGAEAWGGAATRIPKKIKSVGNVSGDPTNITSMKLTKLRKTFVGFEFLRAVSPKMVVFWGM